MRLVGLISGGKDSLYNMLQCISAGHDIVAVANIEPETKAELDSYMYQSVGHEAVTLIAGALGLPIFRHQTKGKALCTSKIYIGTSHDEVEDLHALLSKIKKTIEIDGVAVGAIASDYQRTRVENVCSRLGLKSFAYLWRRDQAELLQEMVDANVDAIIVKVACIGLQPNTHLGMHIKDAVPHFFELNKKFGMNVCGEGGEYETLTLDCPLFHRMIEISETENVVLSDDPFAPVGTLSVKKATLKEKNWKTDDPVLTLQERLKYIRSNIKDAYSFVQDCVDEISENLFPQKQFKSRPDLPFPFEETTADTKDISSNFQEYWNKAHKRKTSSMSSSKLPSSGSLVLSDTSKSSFSFISGWCCIGNITGTSIQDALNCLQRNLERTTYTAQDIVCVNIFMGSLSEFSNMNKVYGHFMPNVLPPARVCVGTILPPDINIILNVVAHKIISKSQRALHTLSDPEREALHVQSISHWAPANIGPYSQCVKIGGLYYLSGQIPLIPGTMEIINKPIFHQCKLTLRHIRRVLQAMDRNLDYSNVFHGICYVTSQAIALDIIELWLYFTSTNHATIAVIVVHELPRNAQLEWEILACSYENPLVDERTEIIDDFDVYMKRCFYVDPFTASLICKISYVKKTKISEKSLRIITPKGLEELVKSCLEFLKRGAKAFAMLLCILKVFYKPTESSLAFSLNDVVNMSFENKVVATAVPVLGCGNPDVILTITGTCQ